MGTAKEIGADDAKLREAGFDPAAAPHDAVAKLKSIGDAGEAGVGAIARALAAIPLAESAALLTEMEHRATGADRREIRRALFRLHQHGIEAPPIEAPVTGAKAGPASEVEAGLSAFITPADADGARVVWIVKSRPGGGLRRLWGLVSEREGLLGATLTPLKRKELRADRAELERQAGVPMVDADWRVADYILCDAYRRTAEANRREAANFFAQRAEIIPTSPPDRLKHPIYDELAPEITKEPAADLMNEPEIAAWRLAPAAVKSYAEEIASLRNSVIVLNRMQQEDRVNTVIERAIAELLSGESGERLRRHLEDTAHYFARRGRGKQAGWAVAAAARLRDGADLKRFAFFQAFMRAQLGALLAEEEQHQREEPRLIMTPAEAMRARQAARGRGRTR